jgi:hypothetical protein
MSLATRRTGHVANLLVRFALASDEAVPAGWTPQAPIQCVVAYAKIWDILHGMYESQARFIALIYLPSPPLSFRFFLPSFFGFRSHPPVK